MGESKNTRRDQPRLVDEREHSILDAHEGHLASSWWVQNSALPFETSGGGLKATFFGVNLEIVLLPAGPCVL